MFLNQCQHFFRVDREVVAEPRGGSTGTGDHGSVGTNGNDLGVGAATSTPQLTWVRFTADAPLGACWDVMWVSCFG